MADDTQQRMMRSMMKAQLWEITKGHLRAMVMLDGQSVEHARVLPEGGFFQGPFQYQISGAAIEAFIKSFEDEGFHE